MRRPGLAHVAIAVAALAAVGTLGAIADRAWHRAGAAQTAGARAAKDLYAISLDDADGRAQPLSQWKGKVLVVNFWATWCAPCVAEMPGLEKIQREYADRNVAIVGIGIDDQDRVRQFRDRLGLHMPLLAGGFNSLGLARAFGDNEGVLPYTALISPEGRLLRTHSGALEPGQLREWLSAIP